MGRIQRRRSISVRPSVYDRLVYYCESGDGRTGSGVTEAALTAFLDAEGVPADVPRVQRPAEVRRERDEAEHAAYDGAHFTF
jgi:hypothetical protein